MSYLFRIYDRALSKLPVDIREQIKVYITGLTCLKCSIRAVMRKGQICQKCYDDLPFPKCCGTYSFKCGANGVSSKSIQSAESLEIKRIRGKHFNHTDNKHKDWQRSCYYKNFECPYCVKEMSKNVWIRSKPLAE